MDGLQTSIMGVRGVGGWGVKGCCNNWQGKEVWRERQRENVRDVEEHGEEELGLHGNVA